MKSIINTLLLLGGLILVLIWGGFLETSKLIDIFAGEPTVGETEQRFKESDFLAQFEAIVGEVEVYDTSKTAIERNLAFCKDAYIITTTQSVIKYSVDASPLLFKIDPVKKEYYISPDLAVQLLKTDEEYNTIIQESNCTKKDDIKADMIRQAQEIANKNYNTAINKSDKILEAQARFEMLKNDIIQQFIDAEYHEKKPEDEFLN